MNEDKAIEEIARLAQEATGVQLGARHRHMIVSRLQRRIDELGVQGMGGYLEYLKANFSAEKKVLISVLTTHHTYFFREIAHFEFLRDQGLAEVVQGLRKQGRNTLRLWSAASSRGQEAYSLAMWILPWLEKNAPDIKLKIFGTDIDAESVKIASNGVYSKSELDEVPLTLLGNHWAKGTGDIANFVKAKASLRSCVEFQVESLFELATNREPFDIIFCRNVFIYFNPEQIKAIGTEMQKRLHPHGFFFVGISETLSGLGLNLDSAAPSTYRLRGSVAAAPKGAAPAASASAAAPLRVVPKAAEPVRVLCVDDSPTILALMKKILTAEHGFQIVGTALNGKEAEAKVKGGGIDLVTLDIHMPEMTGIEYLQKNFKAGHPPVVMVTSVSRENSDLALKALELGASDYVEKPSLADLAERAEEIRFKLKTALGTKRGDKSFDKQFEKKLEVSNAGACLRVVFCALPDLKRAAECLKAAGREDPGTLFFLDGAGGLADSLKTKFSDALGRPVSGNLSDLGPGRFVAADGKESWARALELCRNKSVSILVFGKPSPAMEQKFAQLPAAQVLLEDRGPGERPTLGARAQAWCLPTTSFLYQSQEFFAKGKKAA